MKIDNNTIRGWGISQDTGVKITDTPPLFSRANERAKWLHLLLDPERWIMFSAVEEYIQKYYKKKPIRILVLGCGTGAQVVDLAHYFGKRVDVDGADTVLMHVQMAEEKMRKYGVDAQIHCIGEEKFPWKKGTFDIVYAYDMVTGVEKKEAWVAQIHRVLKATGICITFSLVQPSALCVRERTLQAIKQDEGVLQDTCITAASVLQTLRSAGFVTIKRYGRIISWITWFPESYQWLCNATQGQAKKMQQLQYTCALKKEKRSLFVRQICALAPLLWFYTLGRIWYSDGAVFVAKKQ